MIVLDTHVLAWTVMGERRLGRKAKALVERLWPRGEVAVCALSFWEVGLLRQRGRLDLPTDAAEWRADLMAAGLVELPADGAIGIRALSLGGLPNDPVDRLIVATALHHRAELVTADDQLLGWKHVLVRHDARL